MIANELYPMEILGLVSEKKMEVTSVFESV